MCKLTANHFAEDGKREVSLSEFTPANYNRFSCSITIETLRPGRIERKREKVEEKTVDWGMLKLFRGFWGDANTTKIVSFADAINKKLSVVKSTEFYSLSHVDSKNFSPSAFYKFENP